MPFGEIGWVGTNYRAVDPVVAGSSPVALAKIKAVSATNTSTCGLLRFRFVEWTFGRALPFHKISQELPPSRADTGSRPSRGTETAPLVGAVLASQDVVRRSVG